MLHRDYKKYVKLIKVFLLTLTENYFILNPSKTLCTVDNADTINDNSKPIMLHAVFDNVHVCMCLLTGFLLR